MDWLILVAFILMFVNLGLIAQLLLMPVLADNLLALPGGEITGAALLSQVISNVPASIFLAASSDHWALLAFHLWSMPMLLLSLLGAWLLQLWWG